MEGKDQQAGRADQPASISSRKSTSQPSQQRGQRRLIEGDIDVETRSNSPELAYGQRRATAAQPRKQIVHEDDDDDDDEFDVRLPASRLSMGRRSSVRTAAQGSGGVDVEGNRYIENQDDLNGPSPVPVTAETLRTANKRGADEEGNGPVNIDVPLVNPAEIDQIRSSKLLERAPSKTSHIVPPPPTVEDVEDDGEDHQDKLHGEDGSYSYYAIPKSASTMGPSDSPSRRTTSAGMADSDGDDETGDSRKVSRSRLRPRPSVRDADRRRMPPPPTRPVRPPSYYFEPYTTRASGFEGDDRRPMPRPPTHSARPTSYYGGQNTSTWFGLEGEDRRPMPPPHPRPPYHSAPSYYGGRNTSPGFGLEGENRGLIISPSSSHRPSMVEYGGAYYASPSPYSQRRHDDRPRSSSPSLGRRNQSSARYQDEPRVKRRTRPRNIDEDRRRMPPPSRTDEDRRRMPYGGYPPGYHPSRAPQKQLTLDDLSGPKPLVRRASFTRMRSDSNPANSRHERPLGDNVETMTVDSEDDDHAALDYEGGERGRTRMPLTVESLRRVQGRATSEDSHEHGWPKPKARSTAAMAGSRSSSSGPFTQNSDDITIKIPGSGVIQIGNTKIKLSDDSTVTISGRDGVSSSVRSNYRPSSQPSRKQGKPEPPSHPAEPDGPSTTSLLSSNPPPEQSQSDGNSTESERALDIPPSSTSRVNESISNRPSVPHTPLQQLEACIRIVEAIQAHDRGSAREYASHDMEKVDEEWGWMPRLSLALQHMENFLTVVEKMNGVGVTDVTSETGGRELRLAVVKAAMSESEDLRAIRKSLWTDQTRHKSKQWSRCMDGVQRMYQLLVTVHRSFGGSIDYELTAHRLLLTARHLSRSEDAIDILQNAGDICSKQHLTASSSIMAEIEMERGRAYKRMGQYLNSISWFAHVLTRAGRELPPGDMILLEAKLELVLVHQLMGKDVDAYRILENDENLMMDEGYYGQQARILMPELIAKISSPVVGEPDGTDEQDDTRLATASNEPIAHPSDASHAGVRSLGSFGDSGYGSYANTGQTSKSQNADVVTPNDGDEEDVDDNATVYSVDSVPSKTRDFYIDEFTSCLREDVYCAPMSDDFQTPAFPDHLALILRSFSRRLHAESLSKNEREVSVFLHKHRRTIADTLTAVHVLENSDVSSDHSYGSEDQLDFTLPFIKPQSDIAHWVGSVNSDHAEGLHDAPREALSGVYEYQAFIKHSSAYQWLLAVIHQSRRLTIPGPSTTAKDMSRLISDEILSQLTARRVSSRTAPVMVEMKITLDWDLAEFISQQQYEIKPDQVLDSVIVLTGAWNDAYASTPVDYMKQVWPLTYKPLYGSIKRFLNSGAQACNYDTDEGYHISFEQDGPQLQVGVRGHFDFVLETVEQLAWLASALRPSPISEGVVSCKATVANLHTGKGKEVESAGDIVTVSCEIHFQFDKAEDVEMSLINGHCWFGMFCNPVLVAGYPIPQKTSDEGALGLEISLNFLSLLIDSAEVYRIGERTIFKGFCCLLTIVEATKDLAIWHFLYNPSGNKISFCDPRLGAIPNDAAQALTLRDLEARRHVVGWCGDVTEFTGHPYANWDIFSSSLPHTPSSFVLEKLYVEGGSQVIGGVTGSLGVRDKPVRLRREGTYFSLVDWISSQPIILCDTKDRRAWLVDGASALLHMILASIEQDRQKPVFRHNWKFDGLREGDESPNGGAVAAIKALSNPRILNKILYLDLKETDTGQIIEAPYTFFHRVKEVLHTLEVLVDHQTQFAAQDGYWFRQTGKIINKSVVGFDFWDIAHPPGLVRPRSFYFPWKTLGHGWTDYARQIKATTLFGANFGDLLQPKSLADVCPNWRTVPTGLDYLGVSISTLKALHHSRESVLPGELISKILWSSRCDPFTRCWCVSSTVAKSSVTTASTHCHGHLDPVQMLLPRGQRLHLYVTEAHSSITLAGMDDAGAVVFGHTMPLRDKFKASSSNDEVALQRAGSSADSRDDSSSAGRSSKTTTTLTSVSTPNSLTPKSSQSPSTDMRNNNLVTPPSKTASGTTLSTSVDGRDKKRFSWGMLRMFKS